jgi:predicted AAA+ superfamily ATPase
MEVPTENGDRLWLRGGFPRSYLAPDDPTSFSWREAFLRTYLERDIPQLGPRIPAETLRRFWTMVAHLQGGPFNAARVAGSIGVSGQTVSRYLDLFCDLMLVRRLQPWHSNLGKRLVRAPKVYIRDSGLYHTLLRIRDSEELFGHPSAGASWEGHVLETLIQACPSGTDAYFYRTAGGAEIDLLLSLPGQELVAIEIKRNSAPTVRRGFHEGCKDVKAKRRFVIYPGTERYPLPHDIEAIGLREAARVLADMAK